LKGSDDPVLHPAAKAPVGFGGPKVDAIIRYEVTPDPGLIAGIVGVRLRIYCRRGSGDIHAKLIRVGIPSSQVPSLDEETMITYKNNNSDRRNFFSDLSEPFVGNFDFANNSYYIELTLSGHLPEVVVVTHPPEVALLHLVTGFA
jgi:hypothetical protein